MVIGEPEHILAWLWFPGLILGCIITAPWIIPAPGLPRRGDMADVPIALSLNTGNITHSDTRVLQHMVFDSFRDHVARLRAKDNSMAFLNFTSDAIHSEGLLWGKIDVAIEDVDGSPRVGSGMYIVADTNVTTADVNITKGIEDMHTWMNKTYGDVHRDMGDIISILPTEKGEDEISDMVASDRSPDDEESDGGDQD